VRRGKAIAWRQRLFLPENNAAVVHSSVSLETRSTRRTPFALPHYTIDLQIKVSDEVNPIPMVASGSNTIARVQ
jgi:hypothetical protein